MEKIFNVDVRFKEKVILCKEFNSKEKALRFIKSIQYHVAFDCKIVLLERLENGEYVERTGTFKIKGGI